MGQLLLEGNLAAAKGVFAQLLRWLAFSLLCSDREQGMAWKLTFMADPVQDVSETVAANVGLLEQGLQDGPWQRT